MERELKTQEKELSDDINNLNKKVSPTPFMILHTSDSFHQSKFLEKQFNDAQNQLRDIVSLLCRTYLRPYLLTIVVVPSRTEATITRLVYLYYHCIL